MKVFFWVNVLLCLALAILNFTNDQLAIGVAMLGFAGLNYHNLVRWERRNHNYKILIEDIEEALQKRKIDDLYGRNESAFKDDTEEPK